MKKNLEAAFARPHSETDEFIHHAQAGMTLRDYFAAKAMQAEMSKWKDGHEDGYEGIAELCYCMADAMMKAREE